MYKNLLFFTSLILLITTVINLETNKIPTEIQTSLSLDGAAESVIQLLKHQIPNQSIHLKKIKSDTLQLYCGEQIKLNIKLDDKSYEMFVESPNPWHNLNSYAIKDNNEVLKNDVEIYLKEDMNKCLLSPIKIQGPVNIDLEYPSKINLRMAPEPVMISDVKKLIIHDGASIELSNTKYLDLKHKIVLPDLPSDYIESIFSQERKKEHVKFKKTPYGILNYSSKLLEMSKEDKLELEMGSILDQDIKIKSISKNNKFNIIEQENNIIHIIPQNQEYDDGKYLKEQWAWPFLDLKHQSLWTAENLLKNVISNHWPKFDEKQSKIELLETYINSIIMLIIDMDIEISNENQKTKSIVTFGARILHDSKSKNKPFIPLQVIEKNITRETVTLSPNAIYLSFRNTTANNLENKLFDYNL